MDSFIFVHINKTGGSSIEKALKLNLDHSTALEKMTELGATRWRSKTSFAIVRNPWDRVVSHYRYRVETNQTGLADSNMSFAQWLDAAYARKIPEYYDDPKMFMPQLDWLIDGSGNMLVDKVLRFDKLTEEFNSLCDELNIETRLPHVKSSIRGAYQEYYANERCVAIVADNFAKDIEYFDYTF